MRIKRVIIGPGCIGCGTCQVLCPAVFFVKGMASVRLDGEVLDKYREAIKEAVDICPMQVITI
jgi:ferredoxin